MHLMRKNESHVSRRDRRRIEIFAYPSWANHCKMMQAIGKEEKSVEMKDKFISAKSSYAKDWKTKSVKIRVKSSFCLPACAY